MYQEELYSNVITDAKKAEFDDLSCELKGIEAAIERFFTKIFETSSSLSERDFNVANF